MSSYYSLKVKEVVKETADSVTIHFKQPLFKKVKHKPGQFLTLILKIDGKEQRRSYSICTHPEFEKTVGVTIKRVQGGAVSNYINDRIKEGDSIDVMEPMGNFVFEGSSSAARHIVLIGGGSGITPLMSIIKEALYKESKSQVSLIYSNRDENSIIFKKELDALKAKYGARFTIVHNLNEPSKAWGGYKGTLDQSTLINILNLLPKGLPADYYLCGPEGLMDLAKESLHFLKVPSGKIHRESFVAAAAAPAAATVGGDAREVTIKYEGTEHKVMVPANKSILAAGLEAGINLPFSCQSGVCTACLSRCVSGKVDMGNNDTLTDAEMAGGQVLICVSHAKTDDVYIEVGG